MKKNPVLTKKFKAAMIISLASILSLLMLLAFPGCSEQDAAAVGVTAAAGLAGVWICFIVIAWLFGIFMFVVWIIMLIDCARKANEDFPNANENTKLVWILIIVLAGSVGAIIYYFLVFRKSRRKGIETSEVKNK